MKIIIFISLLFSPFFLSFSDNNVPPSPIPQTNYLSIKYLKSVKNFDELANFENQYFIYRGPSGGGFGKTINDPEIGSFYQKKANSLFMQDASNITEIDKSSYVGTILTNYGNYKFEKLALISYNNLSNYVYQKLGYKCDLSPHLDLSLYFTPGPFREPRYFSKLDIAYEEGNDIYLYNDIYLEHEMGFDNDSSNYNLILKLNLNSLKVDNAWLSYYISNQMIGEFNEIYSNQLRYYQKGIRITQRNDINNYLNDITLTTNNIPIITFADFKDVSLPEYVEINSKTKNSLFGTTKLFFNQNGDIYGIANTLDGIYLYRFIH